MEDGTYIIGREDQRRRDRGAPGSGADRRGGGRFVALGDPTVSQRHAELVVLGGRCYLTDLGSTNGTYIVRAGIAEPFREGYVALDTELIFGEHRCTVRQLLQHG